MSEQPITSGEPLIPSGDTGYDLLGVLGLPCRWRDVLAGTPDLPERTMRDMLREVGCAAPYGIIKTLVTEGEHRLVPRFADPGTEGKRSDKTKFNKAKRLLDFHEAWTAALPIGRKLRNLTEQAMECVAFGHKLAEVEWSDTTLLPVDIAPKPRLNYSFDLDRSNRVKGVKAGESTLPPANFLLWTFGGADYNPRGEGCTVAAYPAYYDKGLTRIRQQKSVDQAGGGFLVLEEQYPPQGVPLTETVKVRDSSGTLTEALKSTVAVQQAKKVRSNDVAKLPAGVTAKFLSVDSHGLFDAVFDRDDREMTLAFLKVLRATMEARFGSKADSQTGEGLLDSVRDGLRALICDPINGLIDLVTVLHFGPEWLEFAPRYEIVTEEPQDTVEIGKFLQGDLSNFTLTQLNFFCDRAGIPIFEEHPGENVEEESVQPVPAQELDEEGNPVQFKSSIASVNASAQRALESAVKKHDRRLRELVSQLAAGEIDRDAFVADFGDVLFKGHDQAFRLGWRHGGGGRAIDEAAENYIAETVSVQGNYASGLADDILAGDASESAGLARADQYARRMRGSANRAFIKASDPETAFNWTLGGNENHCSTCPEYASMNPWFKDTAFASPGEDVDASGTKATECGSACLCKWVRDDGREGFGPVSFD